MNKKLIAIVMTALFVMAMGTASAADFKFDGTASVQHRWNTADGSGDAANNIFKFVLNAKAADFAPNLDLFFRVGGEWTSNGTIGDYAQFPGSDPNHEVSLDQYGVVYKAGGFNYSFGRQTAAVGATALLYDNTFKVGRYVMVDGLIVSGKSGVADLTFAAVRTNNYGTNVNPKVYVAAANFAVADNLKLGATFAKTSGAESDVVNRNNVAVNASYTFGKAVLDAEYAKSSASTSNKAYDFGVTYSFDKANAVYVIAHKVEANGDIAGMTTFDNGEKGTYYGFNHKFDNTSTLKLFYKSNKNIVTDAKNTSLRATLVYSF